ncbi:tetratricopeptide repeat protein [Desulforhopalus singaporensis]|uniref:Uncharacterized protein n=1 Tax=Desulforhopalus singaporensis TaxID=91360 RepID=A0A1H0S6C8_9BACT|nr:tetratricopeptide repeat protein [Desulforhopalus singaporensis]SDP37323.1 hypothetical protein SAMN05660330_02560 [Desulforhopalus singaporensis]
MIRLIHLPLLLVVIGTSVLTAFAADTASPASDRDLFEQANRAYSQGSYRRAIDLYEEIVNRSGYSAAVLYNLANSYAQAGMTGKAIVNYERTKVLAPSDFDIGGNLEKIKKENGLFRQAPSIKEKVLTRLSLDRWALLILLVFGLFTLFVVMAVKIRFSRPVILVTGVACLVVLALGVAGVFFQRQQTKYAVVISPAAKLLISPFDNATPVGTIREGRLVYPGKTHQVFTYVMDKTGRKGWIPTDQIEKIF